MFMEHNSIAEKKNYYEKQSRHETQVGLESVGQGPKTVGKA